MIQNYFEGNIDVASNMQIDASGIIECLFKEVNPIPVKEALNILGYNCGKPRLPLIECSNKLKEDLELKIRQV